MRIVTVKSLPLKEVIRDLAKEFDTNYEEDCEEYRLVLPPRIGVGDIRGINFSSGLGLILYDCEFKEDMELRFTVNKVHPAKFLFCRVGKLSHQFDNESIKHNIYENQNAIVASSDRNGHILYFEKNVKVEINSLEIDREQFKGKIECNLDEIENELKDLFLDVNAKNTFYHSGNYSLKLADSFSEIENFSQQGAIRRIFLEGQALQILTQQILQYQDDIKNESLQSVLRKSDVDTIMEAALIIKQELSQPLRLQDLAARLGTNVNKLQEGFKILHSSTVNLFLQAARLESAREMLIFSDLNVSEIVYALGLSSRSYFSKIFKERYGISPKQYRMKYKRKK